MTLYLDEEEDAILISIFWIKYGGDSFCSGKCLDGLGGLSVRRGVDGILEKLF